MQASWSWNTILILILTSLTLLTFGKKKKTLLTCVSVTHYFSHTFFFLPDKLQIEWNGMKLNNVSLFGS